MKTLLLRQSLYVLAFHSAVESGPHDAKHLQCPISAATISGIPPVRRFFRFTSAPLETRKLTISSCPPTEAPESGVVGRAQVGFAANGFASTARGLVTATNECQRPTTTVGTTRMQLRLSTQKTTTLRGNNMVGNFQAAPTLFPNA